LEFFLDFFRVRRKVLEEVSDICGTVYLSLPRVWGSEEKNDISRKKISLI
jgi:hypothetical protein